MDSRNQFNKYSKILKKYCIVQIVACAVTFVGILATVLPMVQNDQLQLVLSSFEMPSGNR